LKEAENSLPQKKQKLDHGEVKKLNKLTMTPASEEEYIKFKLLHTHEELHKSYLHQPNDEEVEKLLLAKKKQQLIKLLKLDEFEDLVKENEQILKENKIITNNLATHTDLNEI
jgi:hypothetical protein